MASSSRVFVYGGRGALGSTCVKYFKSRNWWVGCIGIAANDEAHANVLIESTESWVEQGEQVSKKVAEVLKGEKLDAIICVAGGWAGGNADSEDFLKNCDMMWKQSVWTSAIAAQLAAKHLKEGGVLTLTGAQPCLSGTPGMIGYGMAKAAVHHLVKSMIADKSGLPKDAYVGTILPVTLDTPMNRKFMPNADHSSWTPLETVAELFYNWTQGSGRMENGALIQLITKDNKTEFVPA